MKSLKEHYEKTKSNAKFLWVLYFVFPLVPFIIAVNNFNIKKYRKFIILFAVLYGYTFIPIPESDGAGYAAIIESMKTYSAEQYFHDITNIYGNDTQFPDIYAFTLFYITTKLSGGPQIFHLLTSLIYFIIFIGFLGTIRSLTPQIRGKYYIWFFLGCVFITNLSAGINGVRFATALMLFSYGALNMIIFKNVKYLLISITSILIHFSLLFPLIFLIIFFLSGFLKNKIILYVFLFLAITSTFLTSLVLENTTIFGIAFESKITTYTNAQYIETRNAHVSIWNWYVQLNLVASYYFIFIAILISRVFSRSLKQNELTNRLFSFAIIVYSISFISGALVDQISNRYALIAKLFALIYLFYISANNPYNRILKIISRLYIPVFILNALIMLRGDLFTVSPYLIFGNPILMLFLKSDIPLQDLFF